MFFSKLPCPQLPHTNNGYVTCLQPPRKLNLASNMDSIHSLYAERNASSSRWGLIQIAHKTSGTSLLLLWVSLLHFGQNLTNLNLVHSCGDAEMHRRQSLQQLVKSLRIAESVNMSLSTYTKGQEVWYRTKDGTQMPAKVIHLAYHYFIAACAFQCLSLSFHESATRNFSHDGCKDSSCYECPHKSVWRRLRI